MGRVAVRFWGRISDEFGERLDVAMSRPLSIRELRAQLGNGLSDPSIRAVMDGHFCQDDTMVEDGDHVEFLSPVGGG